MSSMPYSAGVLRGDDAWALLRCSATPVELPCRPAAGGPAADVTPSPDSGLNVRTRVQASPP